MRAAVVAALRGIARRAVDMGEDYRLESVW
jgi:hypothetical protein